MPPRSIPVVRYNPEVDDGVVLPPPSEGHHPSALRNRGPIAGKLKRILENSGTRPSQVHTSIVCRHMHALDAQA
jgi:hypothetical protein